jgi:hypothetical protein
MIGRCRANWFHDKNEPRTALYNVRRCALMQTYVALSIRLGLPLALLVEHPHPTAWAMQVIGTIQALPDCMKGPWDDTAAEIRMYDVEMSNIDEMSRY